MATRNISLTAHFDAYIDAAIASGRFQNASEVVRDSLRLHEEQEHAYQAKVEALRAALQVAQDDIDNGRYDVIETDEEMEAWMDNIWEEHVAKHDSAVVASESSE